MAGMCVALSVVSHGHADMVQALLDDLSQRRFLCVVHVVLTLNLPERLPVPPATGWPFRLTVVHSARPNGFARNHNVAFTHCQEDFFCVVNPDVRFLAAVDDPFPALCRAAMQAGVGLAYPMQVDRHGQPMDHERTYPTPLALLCRYMGRAPARRVDWVNGAFMLVQHTIYRQLGGFNERFHMYCEDVDWCLRLRAAGYTLAAVPVPVVHDTQRASRRSPTHMIWHLHSLLKLWCDPLFWRSVRQNR